MEIRFEFFEDTILGTLKNQLDSFVKDKNIQRKNIIKIYNHSVVLLASGAVLNKVMLVYEAAAAVSLKKRSGPRKGVKRGPYKKRKGIGVQVEKALNSGILDRIGTSNTQTPSATAVPVTSLQPGDIVEVTGPAPEAISPESKFYESLEMVVPKKIEEEEKGPKQMGPYEYQKWKQANGM